MANRFFTNALNLLAGQKARAADVEGDFDAVSVGFDKVQTELDALMIVDSTKAPKESPTFVGQVTVPTVTVIGGGQLAINQDAMLAATGLIGTQGDLLDLMVMDSGVAMANTRELLRGSGAVIRTLPFGAAVGATWGYKDDGQDFSSNKLTVIPPVGHRIEWAAVDEPVESTTRGEAGVLKQTQPGIWRFIA
ncbi:hypothetical protein [Chitinimonas sp.]|uniref:hypothetical protein n=1 Tax=Chitinimonas sp. TaxID=1934313 RepID=UPI002F93987E